MNKTKTLIKKFLPVAFILAMAVIITPMEASAAKKPGAVSNIEETKATDKSITFKFTKASNAKSYQIRVYEASSRLDATKNSITVGDNIKRTTKNYTLKSTAKKKVLKSLTSKKTTVTIKGLTNNKYYAVKVRAVNGKKYGKWTTQYFRTTTNGIHRPGTTTATGNNLKKQYSAWMADNVKVIKSGDIGFDLSQFRCTYCAYAAVSDPNSYTMEEVYETYKRGYGTDLEVYHVALEAFKTGGVKATIKKKYYENIKVWCYALVVYPDGNTTSGYAKTLGISPNGWTFSSWSIEVQEQDGWI